jgi:hypothetical protein
MATVLKILPIRAFFALFALIASSAYGANAQQDQVRLPEKPDLRFTCAYSECRFMGGSNIDCAPRGENADLYNVFYSLRSVISDNSTYQIIANKPSQIYFGRQYKREVVPGVITLSEMYILANERILFDKRSFSAEKIIEESIYKRSGDLIFEFSPPSGRRFDGSPVKQKIRYKGKCQLMQNQ